MTKEAQCIQNHFRAIGRENISLPPLNELPRQRKEIKERNLDRSLILHQIEKGTEAFMFQDTKNSYSFIGPICTASPTCLNLFGCLVYLNVLRNYLVLN
jgi:hypothetical protein